MFRTVATKELESDGESDAKSDERLVKGGTGRWRGREAHNEN